MEYVALHTTASATQPKFLSTIALNKNSSRTTSLSFKAPSSKDKDEKHKNISIQKNAPKTSRKTMIAAKQSKAIERLDKMVEEVSETDFSQLCSLRFPPLPNSLSDSSIRSQGRQTNVLSSNKRNYKSKICASQSFSQSHEHHCCSNLNQHTNGPNNRIHSNAYVAHSSNGFVGLPLDELDVDGRSIISSICLLFK